MRLPCFGLSLAYKECPVHHEKSCNHVKGILFVHRDILPGLSEVDLPLFSRVVSPNIVIKARFYKMFDSVPFKHCKELIFTISFSFFIKRARSIRAIDLHNGFLFGVQPILCFIFSYPDHPVRMCAVGFGLDLG